MKRTDFEAPEERFGKRKDRRRPKGRRSVNELKVDAPEASAIKFDDPGLQNLYELGYFTELVGELKSGKEATVYLVRGPRGLLAAKLYSDPEVRSFKNDGLYRQGRYISSARIKKAIEQRSKTGVNAQQALWIMHEYSQLWQMHEAGIPCPRPTVGPGADDISAAGRVVLMEFVGDDEGAAPRLADVKLSEDQAKSAWEQSLTIMTDLLKLGKIHGDYSTYNLLWWQDKVIVIDFPQMVDLKENPQALNILRRDVESLCKSFKSHGIDEEPGLVFLDVKQRAGLSPDPRLPVGLHRR